MSQLTVGRRSHGKEGTCSPLRIYNLLASVWTPDVGLTTLSDDRTSAPASSDSEQVLYSASIVGTPSILAAPRLSADAEEHIYAEISEDYQSSKHIDASLYRVPSSPPPLPLRNPQPIYDEVPHESTVHGEPQRLPLGKKTRPKSAALGQTRRQSSFFANRRTGASTSKIEPAYSTSDIIFLPNRNSKRVQDSYRFSVGSQITRSGFHTLSEDQTTLSSPNLCSPTLAPDYALPKDFIQRPTISTEYTQLPMARSTDHLATRRKTPTAASQSDPSKKNYQNQLWNRHCFSDATLEQNVEEKSPAILQEPTTFHAASLLGMRKFSTRRLRRDLSRLAIEETASTSAQESTSTARSNTDLWHLDHSRKQQPPQKPSRVQSPSMRLRRLLP